MKWKNKAWRKAEHPRLVSERLHKNEKEHVFVISYHHVEGKYMLEDEYTKNPDTFHRRETYSKTVGFFDTIDEAKERVEEIAG